MVNNSNPKRSAASMRLLASATVCLPAAMAAGRLGKVILQTHNAELRAELASWSTHSMLQISECNQILSILMLCFCILGV